MRYLYTDGKFHSVEQNNASTMMQAFNYGTAAFEGMKAFWHADAKNWFIFRPDQHHARICRSAAYLDIDFKMSEPEFVATIQKLIRKNNVQEDVYIRPLVFRNARGVGIGKSSGYGVSIFLDSMPLHSGKEYACCFVSQRRPVDGSYNVKLAGNYLLSFLAIKEAKARGFEMGILLSTDGYLSEAAVMNMFFARDGKLYTPSLACGALAGITRKTIIQLAGEQLGIKVAEGRYRKQQLLSADEVFFTGTGSALNFARQVEKQKFNLKRKDRLALELAQLYHDLTAGKLTQYSEWLVPVL
ncbi:MAG: aminotransferase class IV [bacterium]